MQIIICHNTRTAFCFFEKKNVIVIDENSVLEFKQKSLVLTINKT